MTSSMEISDYKSAPLIEQEIRREMGEGIMESGRPVYDGELDVEEYQRLSSNPDEYKIVYLQFKNDFPHMAKVMAAYFEANNRKNRLVVNQNFEDAAEINSKIRETCSELAKKLRDL